MISPLSLDNAYAVPVLDKWLVHSPLRETAAVVNAVALAQVSIALRDGGAPDPRLRELLEDLLRPPVYPEPLPEDAPCPSKLVIVPTRGCQMRCAYCDFGAAAATGQVLDPELACIAIDHALELVRANGGDTLRIHFFGGEPFAACAVVDAAVHYARAACARHRLDVRFEVSTNGKMDAALAAFAGDYFDTIVVSFDGLPEFQDCNRPNADGSGTSEAVLATIRRLQHMPAQLCLRVCVTDRSVGRMGDMAQWLCETFAFDALNFETLAENAVAARVGLRAPDPYAFARGAIEAERIAKRFGVPTVCAAAELGPARRSSCPLGMDALMLMPDGSLNACYLPPERWEAHGLDLTLGTVSRENGVRLDFTRLNRIRELTRRKPLCEECFCRWSCAGGCHVHQSPPDAPSIRNDFCKQTRAVTACRLLEKLGCRPLADALLRDDAALRRLAEHGNDRLSAREPSA